jgi:hypothetical protein
MGSRPHGKWIADSADKPLAAVIERAELRFPAAIAVSLVYENETQAPQGTRPLRLVQVDHGVVEPAAGHPAQHAAASRAPWALSDSLSAGAETDATFPTLPRTDGDDSKSRKAEDLLFLHVRLRAGVHRLLDEVAEVQRPRGRKIEVFRACCGVAHVVSKDVLF